ncbi:hypothetical protein KKC91_10235 [bacterium]|nr:hypothetical protein [bacterium]
MKNKNTHRHQEDIKLLQPLVDEILEFALNPQQKRKKKIWAEHQALHKTEKIPVCVYYEGIPKPQWKLMLGEDYLKTKSAIAQRIEFDLKRRLWMAKNVPDDHIVWPLITIPAVVSQSVDWGIFFGLVGTDENIDNPLEARKITPAFEEEINVSQLKFRDIAIDEKATSMAIEEANELVEGRLQVHVQYPNLGYSPFDLAAEMRGIQNLMYDVVDSPDKVHALMRFITTAYQKHHLNREKHGWLNCITSDDRKYTAVSFRVNCAYLAPDFNPEALHLSDEWVYISAQTSSGLGPAMYEEFVHAYNARLAGYFTNQTVYYHGCECLDHKLDILATLPNLRRFHVSPWSSVKAARDKFQGKVVLEVHAHPGKVFFCFTRDEMKSDIRRLVTAAEGVSIDLNLSDIHSVNGNPALLTTWAEAAQEAVQEVR